MACRWSIICHRYAVSNNPLIWHDLPNYVQKGPTLFPLGTQNIIHVNITFIQDLLNCKIPATKTRAVGFAFLGDSYTFKNSLYCDN